MEDVVLGDHVCLNIKKKKEDENVYSIQLNVDEVRMEDEGEIVFVAKTKEGSETLNMFLVVKG